MPNIVDVSPKANPAISGQFVSGRMLSLASSEDAQTVFVGSLSSGLWASVDGGRVFDQVAWPQPPDGQFGVPGAIGGFCVPDIVVSPESARFRPDRAPLVMADLTGTGRADIVGFGETGVWTALSNGDGTFQPPRVVLADFGLHAGGWHVEKHVRLVADVTGDGRADIVGFGDAGVYVARGNGDGTFQAPTLVVRDLGYDHGWRVEQHPRMLADVRGLGRLDIIGFGNAGVYIAFNNGNGTFSFQPVPVVPDFGYDQGWRVENHPRFVADVRGVGHADIVGFGNAGVYLAKGKGDGTFGFVPVPVLDDFGYDQGWRVEKHPRMLADVRGLGRADIIGFGEAGVYVARSDGNGGFDFQPVPVIPDLGYDHGWRVDKHPRLLADVRGLGRADIVGFGEAGVYVALSNGDGTFSFQPQTVIADFSYDHAWRTDRHVRALADLRGIGRADIVGFGDAGVYVSLANRDGSYQPPQFVLPNFGFQLTVLAIMRSDRETDDDGVWRSSDGGGTWTRVYQFPKLTDQFGNPVPPPAGQLVWAPGTGHLVFAAGTSALAMSLDAGATFQNVVATAPGQFARVNHVAAVTTPPGSLKPPVVYALGDSQMFVSFDGGVQWTMDLGPVPSRVGGAVGLANSPAASVMVVSPRSLFEVFVAGNQVDDDSTQRHRLLRGDYSQFPTTQASTWEDVVLPNLGGQFSGNVFLKATQPGHGNVIFYSPQRAKTFAGPLDPQDATDWRTLDQSNVVHQDLHGVFLSTAFQATFEDGEYKASGMVWMTSDGGVHWSDDGGQHFHAAENVNSLSCVNIAGVSIDGKGPAMSMGTGDNDGFYTMDGGQNWHSQDYGGGDDDCSFSDPFRPHSMLVFTPRWNEFVNNNGSRRTGETVALYEAPVGELPDSPTHPTNRHMVPGPPYLIPNDPRSSTIFGNIWNANSGFGSKGFRPIVLNLPDDDPKAPGDYVFIRFNAMTPTALLRTQGLLDIDDRNEWQTPGIWRVEKHPRVLADLAGKKRADIVGFGDAGVWTALSNGNGTYAPPQFVLADLGYEAGGWRVEKHVRLVGDITGNKRADIVAFGDAGVYVALGNGDGTFAVTPIPALPDLGYDQGWRVDKHVRLLGDLRGLGRMDIVAFGDAGVYVALSNGDGTFTFQPQPVIPDFGYDQGWRVDKHVRLLADLRGLGRMDIVGFGDAGVYVALSNGDGTFTYQPVTAFDDLGYDQGWRVDKHVRLAADIRGIGRADLVGFGNAGVYVAQSDGNGGFAFQPLPVVDDFGNDQGWRVDKHVRLLADVRGTGVSDIVGFGDAGVYVALSNGNGTFSVQPVPVIDDFGYEAGGWRVDKHLRFAGDLRGIGRGDIIGFGDAGVLAAPSNGDGTFQVPALFVVPNFGHAGKGLVHQVGPVLPTFDTGVVQASGGHVNTVFYVGGNSRNNLWKWTDGLPNWELLVPGRGATQARRFFVNPYDPNVIYIVDLQNVKRSDNGGETWQVDASLEQQLSCGGRIPIGRSELAAGQGDFADIVLTDMKFDPFLPQRRFAVGEAGAFFTDDGVTWIRLLDTAAMRGRPLSCYYDRTSNSTDPALYVAFAGRGVVKISGLPITIFL
jgi:hypothetical protein